MGLVEAPFQASVLRLLHKALPADASRLYSAINAALAIAHGDFLSPPTEADKQRLVQRVEQCCEEETAAHLVRQIQAVTPRQSFFSNAVLESLLECLSARYRSWLRQRESTYYVCLFHFRVLHAALERLAPLLAGEIQTLRNSFAVCNQAIDAMVENFGYYPAWPIVDYTSDFIVGRMLAGQFRYWERESPPPLVNHEGRFQLCPRDAARCALEGRKTQAASNGKSQFPLCSPDCLAAVQREGQRLYRAALNEERGRIRAEPLHRMLSTSGSGIIVGNTPPLRPKPCAPWRNAIFRKRIPTGSLRRAARANLDWYDFREVTMTRFTLYADYQDACRCIEAAKFLPRLRGVKKLVTARNQKRKAKSSR